MTAPASNTQEVVAAPAKFYVKRGGGAPQLLNVTFFNPVSLQYSVANTLAQQGQGKQQYVSQTTAKLTMDLIFDTTDSGRDVRVDTSQIAQLMDPRRTVSNRPRALPYIVVFTWGTFTFQGMVESYKETLDFFAPQGVPLRASVNLTLSRQDKVFANDPTAGPQRGGQADAVTLQPDQSGPTILSSKFKSPVLGGGTGNGASAGTGTGTSLTNAMRRLAAANGLESLRRVAEAVTVPSSLPAAAVAAGGAASGFAGGDGAALGVSVRVGGALSAGVPASAGAFAGLHAAAAGAAASVRVDLDALLPTDLGGVMSVGADARFRLGGQAEQQTGASFSADVGADVSLGDELRFDE